MAAPPNITSCPPLGKLDSLADHYAGGAAKSLSFAKTFQQAVQNSSSAFLDCSQIVLSSDEDGIHFNEDQLRLLGMAMATKALALLG